MAVLVYDCPHCGAQNIGFSVVTVQWHPIQKRRLSIVAACAACNDLTVFLFRNKSPVGTQFAPSQTHGDFMKNSQVEFIEIFPKAEAPEAPLDVPDNVARAFLEASRSRRDGRLGAACAMYRKAMEQGLKQFSPEIEAWRLEKRIDKLAAENRITSELKDWAHELRLDGNEALHGDEEPTRDMCDQMHHLCWFLLTYLYTIPQQVIAARNRREPVAQE